MKKWYTLSSIILLWLVTSSQAFASLEIFCPKDKDISYSTYLAGNYYDKPVVWGAYTLYGPWISPHLNCGSGYVQVKWEIVDHYNTSYYCTQTIWVSGGSGTPVSVWCPKEVTLYCDQVDAYYQYPKPEIWGSGYSLSGPWISKSLNDCGVGSIWVEWRITDGCGKVTICKSVVWVKARPGNISVWWPKDFEADACLDNTDPRYLPYPYGYPEIYNYNKCGKYGINYKDEEYTFPNDPGICKKIVRKWTIIDWCIYNPNGYGYSYEGMWQHTQLIKVISKSKPTISCIGEVRNNAETYAKTAWIDIPIPTITSSCNGQATLKHNSKYATKPYSSDASGNYPIGTTYVVFTVTDACGNYSQCTTKVVVVDKAAPTPYCLVSLITSIAWHTDGIYTMIDPKKFDVGSYDNCTPKEKLVFWAEPARLDCNQLGTSAVKIWVQDEAGNKDFCRVSIILQDNAGMCPKKQEPIKSADTLIIAGLISNMNNEIIDSVQVKLIDSIGSQKVISSGLYKFDSLRNGMTYKVVPTKTKDFLNGVTKEDYTLLIDYLEGRDSSLNALQLLAADIDGNDTINLDDVYLLGYYLLLKGEQIPATQNSWKFVPKSMITEKMIFVNNVIKNVPGYIELAKLNSIKLDADFIGIKIGDINLSLSDTLKSVVNNPILLEQRSRPENRFFQNLSVYPNPFNEKVTFSFIADQSSSIQLVVYDLNGKKMVAQKSAVSSGHNQLILDKSVFKSTGLYYYQISQGNTIFSGKLLYQD
ncbi:MAG: T9SS type A sorting domain-containing protein [Saprospiraceae bacterium]